MHAHTRPLFPLFPLVAFLMACQPTQPSLGSMSASSFMRQIQVPAPSSVALPPPGNMPDGTFMRQIQDRGYLIAGVRTDVLLFGFRNPSTNTIEGFDLDITKEIARAIFGDPERIELKEVISTSRVSSVKEGAVDIVAATMTITKARMDEIDFSDVYYEAGQKVLVAKDSPIKSIQDTAGKRVCALKDSTSAMNITKAQPQAMVIQADKYSDCLFAVQEGRADAVSTDDVVLISLVAQDPNMQIVGDSFTQEPFGIGLAKGHPEFVQFVNGVLAQIKQQNRWQEIHQQWLGLYIPTPQPPTRTAQQAAQ